MHEYKSQEELFQGLIPALNVKIRHLKKNNIKDITKDDIWNYLKENKWKSSIDLTLADMVYDIIHTSNDEFINYKKNIIKKSIFSEF